MSAIAEGHLFVVHGRLETLTRDAAIVVTDDVGLIGDHWLGVTEQRATPLDMTHGWSWVESASAQHVAPHVLAVSIETSYERVLDRIESALREVARVVAAPDRGGSRLPLVAIPVVGIGEGGFTDLRGNVLTALVPRLSVASQRFGLDIALVTPDPAVYAAAQHVRRKDESKLPAALDDHAERLGELARRGRLALFMGAGVSIPSGLPSWHALLDMLARRFDVAGELASADGFSATDKAGLIEKSSKSGFREAVAQAFAGEHRPSLLHALLAALDSHEVITTNYDLLYEDAVRAAGRGIASVMPWESALEKERWILKLHGDIDHPRQIVLTRHHMVRYDAASRPSASMLQSLLLTRHTLFVGVSMTDDNVIRLMHEVEEYREANDVQDTSTFGTVLDVTGDAARSRLWADQLTWLDLDAEVDVPGIRVVELFLDRVAFYASRDSSWLLDERFAGMLSREDQSLAQRARELLRDVSKRDSLAWESLEDRLRALGGNLPADE